MRPPFYCTPEWRAADVKVGCVHADPLIEKAVRRFPRMGSSPKVWSACNDSFWHEGSRHWGHLKLTADQFHDVVTLLNATSGASKHEKRREPRFRVRLPATIVPCDEPDKRKLHNVVVLDISAAGVGIVSTISLDQGRRFILRVGPRLGQVAAALQYTVTHSRKQTDGAFIIGAKFERLLSGAVETPVPTPHKAAGGIPDAVDSEHLMLVEKSLQASLPNSTDQIPADLEKPG